MTPKRILHVVGKMDRAGAETMLMNLYRGIDRTKFQFNFVVFTNESGDFDSEIKSMGGKIYKITEKSSLGRMIALKKLLKRHPEYRILHTHTLFSNAFHILAGKMANVPYLIAHSHNTNAKSSNPLIFGIYKKFSKMIMHVFATHYVSCGVEAANYLFPYQHNVFNLPNSIDTDYFSNIGETERNFLNNEFNIDDSYLKIIQVGRLQPVKNHKFSIEIAKYLKKQNIKFKMFFIGQGELLDEINNQIDSEGLQNNVFLIGLRKDIPQLMAGADVMLLPSFHEGFPVVLVEAQAVGVTSVISDKISKEVDLGLDLILFNSLQSPLSNWVDNLLSAKRTKPKDKYERLIILQDLGFDIKSNVQALSNFYNNMK